MNKKKNEKMKEYYILDRNGGLHLTPTGYFKLLKGVIFRTKGFDSYSNEQGIITEPDYVTWTTFKYTYNFPYRGFFKDKYNIEMNTKIQIMNDDDINLILDIKPIFVYLNWNERMRLDCRFKNLLIQKKDFWMWLTNVIVALGATIAGFLVVFH